MKKRYFTHIVPLFLMVVFFGGCAVVTGHKDSLNEFDKKVLANDCNFADIEEKLQDDDDQLLWAIQGGSLARNCQDYSQSNHYFDFAEKVYQESVDEDGFISNSLEVAGSVGVNNNINDFEGNTYEKIMVNTYKALNFASLGDVANARVEFNRALDRQRRAKEFFEDEIKEQQEKQAKEEQEFQEEKAQDRSKQNFNSPKEVLSNKATQKVIYDHYSSSFAEFKAYPDFVNPFTTYMAGLFFMLNGDPIKGRDLLKEALGMNPESKTMSEDLLLSDMLVKNDPNYTDKKFVWIVYEDGHSMKLVEQKIRVPLFILSNNVTLTPIAFPNLEEQTNSHNFLSVNEAQTEEIASMDRVIKTEFQKRYKLIITEILFSNILKATMQYQLQQETGAVGGLLGMLYQAATNTADVRSWTTLPKDFQATRVENSGKALEIKDDQGVVVGQVEVPQNRNAIIYIRSEVQQNNRIHKIIF